MHLSLDAMSLVDDRCLSPGNFQELGKCSVFAAGNRVHSIDVILGFSKDQEPLLGPAGTSGPHEVDIEGLVHSGKEQDSPLHPFYSANLYSLKKGDTEQQQQQQFHGE